MEIRRYQADDLQQVVRLFFETVHAVNGKDYSEEQLYAWAPEAADLSVWDASLRSHLTYVVAVGGRIVGFGDIDGTGYLDRLFVHKDFQRQGIATLLCDRLESGVGGGRIEVHASITARPFFEKRGYATLCKASVERQGVRLAYYVMEKHL